ncbi:MAG TPA: RagB/SusD family nutrient uptake outer membrane protein [Bacteroidales bacterium]|nr:RagB/SusD family nutrient uptake outer membrane protein [Bacteroidales bacterium]
MIYKLLILSIFLSIISISCNDFLDLPPTGTLTTDSQLSSAESAQALVNSAYRRSNVFNTSTATWGGFTSLLLEYMTGKCTSENSQSMIKDFLDLTVSSRTHYLEDWWEGCYAGIADCNYALNKLKEFPTLNEDLLSKYTGEIKFMRALYYFYLVRIYGDVPKLTDTQYELSELQVSRTPVKEIYDEIIIPDLLEAEISLLPTKDQTGRISMGAVKSLLADVYLTYAGYPVQGGEQYYTESAKRSLDVIKSGAYTLFPTYEDLWSPSQNNKGEFIFQIQFAVNMRSNNFVAIPLPTRSGMSAFGLEFGSLIPTPEFVESFPEGDIRTEEKQFFITNYVGHPSKFSPGAPELEFMDFHGYYIHKYFDKNAIDVAGQSGLNWTIYRYADVLLMYAEAQIMAEGTPNEEAFNALNLIRNRAGLIPFDNTNMEAFKKEVWDQRYFELCYENKMWFDMLRTRLIRDDNTGAYVTFIGYKNNWGKVYSQTQLLFPIPLREMQTNTNLDQNPGY